MLHPDRLLPADGTALGHARDIFAAIENLPIFSPHGHTDPAWFASNAAFENATDLLLTPDHYVLRMLRAQGVSYDDLGLVRRGGGGGADPRDAWRVFARHYHLFVGTPSQLWIDHALAWAFGITRRLSADTADLIYDQINEGLADPALRPMAILERAKVQMIATTEMALDPLAQHRALERQGLIGRICTTYRPDDVTDPDHPTWAANLAALGVMTGQDIADWQGMIAAHRARRAQFRALGAVATDHGTPDMTTHDLPDAAKQALLTRLLNGQGQRGDAGLFRGQMLLEMAALSIEDGMVMQLHAGVQRNTDPRLLADFGPNLGADIPCAVSPVQGLGPLLARYGHDPHLRLIVFCMDESVYARELAPIAGYWPCLRLGPPWWFMDSPRGMARYFDSVVETAGYYNLAGFNDDTRALLSIPARHDVWRRAVATHLAQSLGQRQISLSEAQDLAIWLADGAARAAYRPTR